ncbi:MAG: hypothetical protein QW343_00765 [Candidatus Norongarragalinales archaeon]
MNFISLESLSAFGEKTAAAAYNAVLGFAALAKRHPKTTAVAVAVLLLAACMNFISNAEMRDIVKEKQAAQEKQFQTALREAQQKRFEDAQRAKIAFDAQRKGELQNELMRFSNAFVFDMEKLNATGVEYGSDKLNEYNFARKVETAKKLILVINEFKAHLDGFRQFVHKNFAEFKRLGMVKQDASEAEVLKESEKIEAHLKKMLVEGKAEFEEFVGSNAARLKVAAEVLQLAEDAIASFEENNSG